MINVTKLFKESIQGYDNLDAQSKDVRDDDINLSSIKLKVESITWNRISQSDERPGHPRTVKINKSNTTGPGAFGQVHTTKESENFIRVIIEQGVVKGINRTLKLPLDQSETELIQAFGDCVEVDPSKALSEPQQNRMKIGVSVEGDLGNRGATASVCNKEKEYKGHFECKVTMRGKGLACGIQNEIGECIDQLKKQQPKNDDLKALKIYTLAKTHGFQKVVQFTMVGELECKWDFEQTVEWK